MIMVATVFRILHASDFHIGTTPWDPGNKFTAWIAKKLGIASLTQSWRRVAHDANVQRAFAVFAHDMREKVDALIITGDLATTGYPSDLRAAHGADGVKLCFLVRMGSNFVFHADGVSCGWGHADGVKLCGWGLCGWGHLCGWGQTLFFVCGPR